MERREINIDSALNGLYYDLKQNSAFSSIKTLYDACKRNNIKISYKSLKTWLSKQDSYTLHKQVKNRFKRNKILVSKINDIWQIDLVDMQKYASDNCGYKYLLTCIDTFSKYAWVKPLKNKLGQTVLNSFKNILKHSKQKPLKIHSDDGKEFLNLNFQSLLKKNKIGFFTTHNDTKACIVERFHRTLKSKMWRYFTFKNTTKYIDILQLLVKNYNESYHRSIKMRPIEVTNDNSNIVFQNIYGNSGFKKSTTKPKFDINDSVRISKKKLLFEKGYESNWSDEVFIIKSIIRREKYIYTVKDLNNEEVKGTFYEEELQKVIKTDSDIWLIEKIIKKRKHNNKIQFYVKWKGYPPSFNSWINKTQLV